MQLPVQQKKPTKNNQPTQNSSVLHTNNFYYITAHQKALNWTSINIISCLYVAFELGRPIIFTIQFDSFNYWNHLSYFCFVNPD